MTAPRKPLHILISGQYGQVSQALQHSLKDIGRLTVLGRDQFDLSHPQSLRATVRELKPDLIINPAAYTAVDQAESEPKLALAINGVSPGVLAEEAATLGIPLIHYSTDYVFDGTGDAPWKESDAPRPLSVYGSSKLAGERAITTVGGQHLILRTSWVYSLTGRNFLLTLQRLLQEREKMTVVADQIGAPTWAGTIAGSTRQLIERWQEGEAHPWGVYHLTAEGETSWFGFAQAIGQHLIRQGKPCAALEPIPSSAYPTPAARPLNSRLDCSLLSDKWGVRQPAWHDALSECLALQR
ncbi:dTDP-4-dehydrorhamnose reductase [Pseudomonas huanghezhanensis]|uniref:dTDP-4-dehydrorhamnose reductase n=1 Tax=Pseudomonas huanghezhanensis TaxID=3002903 RepID=UPI0022861C03|nr:dTDP-4-dehydrorhamnose reductase [Pseudomonas sp. BSw22131]